MKKSTGQLDIFELFAEESQREETSFQERVKVQTNSNPRKPSVNIQIERNPNLSFGLKYAAEIEMYLKLKLTVRQICERLIKEHGAPNETYLTGKPKIYPYVMMYLDALVEQGLCIAKRRDVYDGIYEWIE
jgi:hypothetical protein